MKRGPYAKKRIPSSERLSKEILRLIEHLKLEGGKQQPLAKILELGIRKFIQELLEEEVEQHIGKAYYEHGKERNGYRNGYKPAYLRTAEGKLLIEKPQVSDSREKFESALWKHIKANTERLEEIVIEMPACRQTGMRGVVLLEILKNYLRINKVIFYYPGLQSADSTRDSGKNMRHFASKIYQDMIWSICSVMRYTSPYDCIKVLKRLF